MISREEAEAVCKWLELPASVRRVVDPEWYAFCLREGIELEDMLTPFQKLGIALDDLVEAVRLDLADDWRSFCEFWWSL